jgi:hypothetical protein
MNPSSILATLSNTAAIRVPEAVPAVLRVIVHPNGLMIFPKVVLSIASTWLRETCRFFILSIAPFLFTAFARFGIGLQFLILFLAALPAQLLIFGSTFVYNTYYALVTKPLHLFYFVGPIWKNLDDTQICFELTRVDSAWWDATDDRRLECDKLLSKRFGSFEATIVCTLYFAAIIGIALYFICRCCLVRPLVNEFKDIVKRN